MANIVYAGNPEFWIKVRLCHGSGYWKEFRHCSNFLLRESRIEFTNQEDGSTTVIPWSAVEIMNFGEEKQSMDKEMP